MGDKSEKPLSTGTSKKKRDEKSSRRDPRSWENVTKHIINFSDEDKMKYISEKYVDMYNELRKVVKTFQNMEKSYTVLQKEKDQLQGEQTRSILAKATLESLCRELQKQNKQIKEENIQRLKEDEEKRKEVATKFTEKLNDISQMMEENKDKSWKLRDENIKMTTKLSDLHQQFKERDDNLAKMNKQMELSQQLSAAQIQKLEFELNTERQIWAKEKEILKTNLKISETNCKTLEETVADLKSHVEVYRGQYSDFETTMSKSNKIFENFKTEMSKMSKKVTLLEKESNQWKARYQAGASTLLEVSQLNQQQNFEIKRFEGRLATLSKLCRQLQIDRAAFLKQLKMNNIEPVESAVEEVQPEKPVIAEELITKPKKHPETKKEKELVKLKQDLEVLQEQLQNTILNEAAEKNGNSQKPEPENLPTEETTTETVDDNTKISEPADIQTD
ncbi:unnamed protein product [Brassicogethes aeneus]|uniref:Alpha-taxilin n=1 Tax=Brassicogethes aeneus TaxID=1431903 RepID=A0A9P0BD48_BRAAE|nr:unnamed protein product [Brassicogethes aeneus]